MSNIPVIVLNRDRLTYTRNLLGQLSKLGYENLIIYDQGSTYQPLIDWYKTCSYEVYLADNSGHKAIWNNGFLKKFEMYPFVAVSDSDISLHPDTPADFIEQMITVAKDYRVSKVGLAIEYKNMTNEYLRRIIYPIESNYWKQKLVHNKYTIYSAPVDTTMCIVNPLLPFQYQALRWADYPIHHLDWNSDWSNLTDEERFYFDNADESIATTKAHYLKYLSGK